MDILAIYLTTCACIFLFSYLSFRFSDSIKCMFFGHNAVYVGKKSGMVFSSEGRGVTGSMRDIHCCGRCGKSLDH